MFINSKHKGSFAVAQSVAKLYSIGYEISLPIGDRKPYDLIIDDGKKLYKVQVKYAGVSSKGNCKAGLRVTGGNQSYSYAKKYGNNEFDYLYVYTASQKHFLIPWKKLLNRNEISIDCFKYKRFEVK